MESHAKKRWKNYQNDNPKIIGESVVPKNLVDTCNIFWDLIHLTEIFIFRRILGL